MSAQVIEAFQQEAHRLDAEADNAAVTDQAGVEVVVKHEIAEVLRNLALRAQGTDPAAKAAEDAAAAETAAGGLSVEKTEGEPDPTGDQSGTGSQ